MSKSRILIVDDEPAIRKFLVRVVENANYEVSSASNGHEALALLKSHEFDLLLTDIKMNQLDGVGLLEEAKNLYPELAVILLTGHASVASAVAALRKGAVNYLLKPVKNEEILGAIQQGLEVRLREQRRNRLETIAAEFADVVRDPTHPTSRITCGQMTLDIENHTVEVENQPIALTPTEFRLLYTLCQGAGKVFTYVDLVQAACGYTCSRQESREIIGTHIRNLRRRLDEQQVQSVQLESVRGIGYRLR